MPKCKHGSVIYLYFTVLSRNPPNRCCRSSQELKFSFRLYERDNFTQVGGVCVNQPAIIRIADANENGAPLKRVSDKWGRLLLSLFHRRVRRGTILQRGRVVYFRAFSNYGGAPRSATISWPRPMKYKLVTTTWIASSCEQMYPRHGHASRHEIPTHFPRS